MNKIPLKQAISSGAWYECRAKYYDEKLHFRLRFLGFERSSVDELDPSNEHGVTVEAVLWLLSVEVVNLNKKATAAYHVRKVSKIIDGDGFEFPFFDSNLDSDEQSPLHRFSGWSSNPPLSPKIKAKGAIAFVLPDEENNYYYALTEGSIKEA